MTTKIGRQIVRGKGNFTAMAVAELRGSLKVTATVRLRAL
jgi:hypothetical protein